MKSETRFAVTLASFNSAGMTLAVLAPTYLDSRLPGHVLYPQGREYPLGYWILLVGPAIFLATIAVHRVIKKRPARMLALSSPLLLFGGLSLFNFFPEFPHGFAGLWGLVYLLASVVASWIRYGKVRLKGINDPAIDAGLRSDRIKEGVTMWRTIATSMLFGYMVLIISWCSLITTQVKLVSTDPSEQWTIHNASVGALLLYSIFVLLGPVREAFRKAGVVADLLTTKAKN